jgi:hypothetical protein
VTSDLRFNMDAISIRSTSTFHSFWVVRFQVLTVTSMKMAVVWDAAPCSLIDIDVSD